MPEAGHEQGQTLAEHGAKDAAEHQRRAEHAAAEAGAERDRCGNQLGDQQDQQEQQAQVAIEQHLDRAMPAAEHLRYDERHNGDQQAADRRTQPLR
jgi:hypothetical protein